MNASADKNTYTKAGSSASKQSVLMGLKIKKDWLKNGSENVIAVTFSGELKSALNDLEEIARSDKLLLPIVSLRVLFASKLDNVFSVNRRLTDSNYPAMKLLASEGDMEVICEEISSVLLQWIRDHLDVWVERKDLDIDGPIARLRESAFPQNIGLGIESEPYINIGTGIPNYPLIAKVIADRLSGEVLFVDQGPCDIVTSPFPNSNAIELSAQPQTLVSAFGRGRNEKHSMVARIGLVNLPYSNGDLYLNIKAQRRVWSMNKPGAGEWSMKKATAYIYGPGKPVIPTTIRRTENGWEFGDEYNALLRESKGNLPASLEEAIDACSAEPRNGWWVGLPEDTRLFQSIAPRTVYETDEYELCRTVESILGPLIDHKGIDFRSINLRGFGTKTIQKMLKVEDLEYGVAGTWLAQQETTDQEEDVDDDNRSDRLKTNRDQNINALKLIHNNTPTLWVFGGTDDEKRHIEKAVDLLFGNAVTIEQQPLPEGAHGLKKELEGKDLPPNARFQLRVNAWKKRATEKIAEITKDNPITALIIAPDWIGRVHEDRVNYYAGIHAWSRVGANVHYLLPKNDRISDETKSTQDFLHRAQSALLDVLLAHSGVVFNTQPLVQQLVSENKRPNAVYGIQIERSKARYRSGEKNVQFILFTRLMIDTGIVEIKVAYKRGGQNELTSWMSLSKGLQWIGSQRHLHNSNEAWLRSSFGGLVNQELRAIYQEDKCAIVMVDWQSTAGLWKGLRDEDLQSSSVPMLDGFDLSRFDGMTLIRLRRGSNTITLRTSVTNNYQGVNDAGQRSGDIYKEHYITTHKSLIEVSNHSPANTRYGHFIAAMGYSKNVQLSRGFSCYRETLRMVKNKGGSNYTLETREPGNKNAALPAASEITVVMAPEGVDPSKYAILATSLRLGFAHYNDWTALPAPLFFLKKVKDYVIRFPESDDEEDSIFPDSDLHSSLLDIDVNDDISTTSTADLFRWQHESPARELEPQTLSSKKKLTEEVTHLATDIQSSVTPITDSDNDLLLEAKSLKVVSLDSNSVEEKYRKLFWMAIDGRINVSIELPDFANEGKLIRFNVPVARRTAKRAWINIAGLKKPLEKTNSSVIKKERPTAERFHALVESWIQVPQGAVAITAVSQGLGPFNFIPMIDIIETVVNPSLPDEEKVLAYGFDSMKLAKLTHWAIENNSDDLLAWIIFLLAQYPNAGWAEAVFNMVDCSLGELTDQALNYYISCAKAFKEQDLRNAKNTSRIGFEEHSQRMPSLEPVDTRENTGQKINNADTSVQSVCVLKSKIQECLSTIEPGKDDFDELANQINADIELLVSLHVEAVREAKESELRRIEEERKKEEDLIAAERKRAEDIRKEKEHVILANSIKESLDQFVENLNVIEILSNEVGALKTFNIDDFVKSTDEDLERDSALICSLSNALSEAKVVCSKLNEFQRQPVPVALSELKFHTEKNATLLNEVVSSTEAISQLIAKSRFIISSNNRELDSSSVTDTDFENAESDINANDINKLHSLAPCTDFTDNNKTTSNSIRPKGELSEDVDIYIERDADDDVCIAKEIGILRALVKERLYGLAEVHVLALDRHLEISEDDIFEHQRSLLASVVSSIDKMDCHSSYSGSLHKYQRSILLAESELPRIGAELDSIALAFVGSTIGAVLFGDKEGRWNIAAAVESHISKRPALASLVRYIDESFQRNYQLRYDLNPEQFLASKVGDKRAYDMEIERYRKKAENWLNVPEIHSNFKHVGFTRANEELFSANHPVGRCLQAIKSGDNSRVKKAYENAKRKFDKASQTFEEVFSRSRSRTKADGSKRRDAINNIVVTDNFIKDYLTLCERAGKPNSNTLPVIQTFLDKLYDLLKSAIDEARSAFNENELDKLYCDIGARGLDCILRLYDDITPAPCLLNLHQRALLDLPLDSDLYPVINDVDAATTALCLPAEVFSAVGAWVTDEDICIDVEDHESVVEAQYDALQTHLTAKRFLPVFLLEGWLKNTSKKLPDIKRLHEECLIALKSDLEDARQRVTNAMTLDAVQIELADRMIQAIESISSAITDEKPIGRPGSNSLAYYDFPQARAALSRNVTTKLDVVYTAAKRRIIQELEELYENGRVKDGDLARMNSFLSAGDAASIRTANDGLVFIKTNGALPERLRNREYLSIRYENILSKVHSDTATHRASIDSLKESLEKEVSGDDPDWLKDISSNDKNGALSLISDWESLFDIFVSKDSNLAVNFFKAIGLPQRSLSLMPHNDRVGKCSFPLDVDTFASLPSTDDELFIPPTLGSLANYLEAIVVRGNPDVDALRNAVKDMGATPTILCTRKRLTLAERAKITDQRPVFIIDDDLITYAALNYENRREQLIKVGMLTFWSNPFDDYNTQPVPPEMFFGRKQELQKLQNAKGMVVLYGGRRLGKSSLLSQLELAVSNSSSEGAVFLSIRMLDTNGDYEKTMWDTLCQAISDAGYIDPLRKAKTWQGYTNHIKVELKKRGPSKLYLLIDEADKLMERELRLPQDEDGFVAALFQLTEDLRSTCLLLPVYAGLHNVARMDAERSSNSVYGRADAIPLKPFSGQEDMNLGVKLIVKPLEALGYYFEEKDGDLPLRIMSVCNFYPAFIQLYCKRLVERLQNNRQNKQPPIQIKPADLDDVEKDTILLSNLRQKFEYSLELDKRYKAIALLLADVWHSDNAEGVNRGLTRSEIREYCQVFCARHFINTGPGAYDALLDEMEKLNVIVKNSGRYILRTHNIAMMIGDRQEVLDKMEALDAETPVAQRANGERRVIMSRIGKGKKTELTFPMPAAWVRRYFNEHSTDEAMPILLGNDISGIDVFKATKGSTWNLERGIVTLGSGSLPTKVNNIAKSRRGLSKELEQQLMLVPPECWRIDQLDELAFLAQKADRSGVRIALFGGPERALEMAHAVDAGSLLLNVDSNIKWRIDTIPTWSVDAVYFFVSNIIENHTIADNDTYLKKIIDATGGFGIETEKLCKQINKDNFEKCCINFSKSLAPNVSAFYTRLGFPKAFTDEQREKAELLLVGVDGIPRHSNEDPYELSDELRDAMEAAEISIGTVKYLQWMGLMQESNDGNWSIPSLYANLFKGGT